MKFLLRPKSNITYDLYRSIGIIARNCIEIDCSEFFNKRQIIQNFLWEISKIQYKSGIMRFFVDKKKRE